MTDQSVRSSTVIGGHPPVGGGRADGAGAVGAVNINVDLAEYMQARGYQVDSTGGRVNMQLTDIRSRLGNHFTRVYSTFQSELFASLYYYSNTLVAISVGIFTLWFIATTILFQYELERRTGQVIKELPNRPSLYAIMAVYCFLMAAAVVFKLFSGAGAPNFNEMISQQYGSIKGKTNHVTGQSLPELVSPSVDMWSVAGCMLGVVLAIVGNWMISIEQVIAGLVMIGFGAWLAKYTLSMLIDLRWHSTLVQMDTILELAERVKKACMQSHRVIDLSSEMTEVTRHREALDKLMNAGKPRA